MNIHIITIGKPKLSYAQAGWSEYLQRLQHFHTVRTTHLADKYASDSRKIIDTTGRAHVVALVIDGPQLSSPELAQQLNNWAIAGQEVCFLIGGPDGLPDEVLQICKTKLSFSRLTFPHDLAMVVLVEALYRASSINSGQPYHR